MGAYRKFNDALRNHVHPPDPPKASNPPNVPDQVCPTRRTLGVLAGLDGAAGETENSHAVSVGTPATWGEAGEERAAIVEHEGNIPRAWAEGFARLNPDRAPGDVPLKRWQRFVDDVGLFLDSPFCAVAAALGWGPVDLFGCDRDRPFARIDQAGLLWLLNGDKLGALSENTATIETRTGARHTYRRKLDALGRVLAWELRP